MGALEIPNSTLGPAFHEQLSSHSPVALVWDDHKFSMWCSVHLASAMQRADATADSCSWHLVCVLEVI